MSDSSAWPGAKLAEYYDDNTFSDVTIRWSYAPGSQTFKLHRIVLALGSTFFAEVFKAGNAEKSGEVTVKDSSDNFGILLQFLYGRVCVSEQLDSGDLSVQDLLELHDLAETYGVPTLKEAIETTFDNMTDIQDEAEDFVACLSEYPQDDVSAVKTKRMAVLLRFCCKRIEQLKCRQDFVGVLNINPELGVAIVRELAKEEQMGRLLTGQANNQ